MTIVRMVTEDVCNINEECACGLDWSKPHGVYCTLKDCSWRTITSKQILLVNTWLIHIASSFDGFIYSYYTGFIRIPVYIAYLL